MKFDVAVIGGGPGGYTAAAEAAKKGLSVVLFEKAELGGTCLNRGCIPTKALLHTAELYKEMKAAQVFGIKAAGLEVDFSALQARKNAVVTTLRQGIEKLLKSAKVVVVQGQATLTGLGRVSCNGEEYQCEHIIIATGSKPFVPPIPGSELPGCYDSNAVLEGEGLEVKSLIIIGGGVIGMECASLYAPLGCQVTVLEACDHILPPMDKEIAQRLGMYMKKQGVAINDKCKVVGIAGEPGKMVVTYLNKKGAECQAEAEAVLIATGRRANLDGLLPENSDLLPEGQQLQLERGAVVGDALGATNLPKVYVIGDAKFGNIQLAHVASAQAENIAAHIAGEPLPVDMKVIPSCVYTSPEIACVGLTEEEAKAAGYQVKAKKAVTGANGKCLIENSESGYVKLVSDAATGVILGAQLVCPRATDMIAELALAVEKGLTLEQFVAVVHPHPTFVELIREAANQ